jgi:hypothetical protein
MELTTKQYSGLRQISMRAVTKAINKSHNLPGVKRIRRVNSSFLLVMNKNYLSEIQSFMKKNGN